VAELPRGGSSVGMGTILTIKVGSRAVDVEQQLIIATLEACAGNKQKAAEILGVSLKTLYNRLAAYKEAEKV
jgi:DNA-binding NtrC family response regulator